MCKFHYDWKLSETVFTKDKGTVFSCFACGGGSTMGYKLAGFDVIGCNEIDPRMMDAYRANHNPKYSFLEPIQTFKLRDDLPDELYDLDILDGSPPCSSFSSAGNREKDWGKEKKFREGQADQILDTLFFDFIELAKKLQPKVVIAENVKGLLIGRSKNYVNEIIRAFDDAGYFVEYALLDASKMGVPQKRERVFFTAIRKNLYSGVFSDLFATRPVIDLCFCENEITFSTIQDNNGRGLTGLLLEIWRNRIHGDSDMSCTNARFRNKPNTGFGQNYLYGNRVCGTITAHEDCQVLFDHPIYTSKAEVCKIGTFPTDYNFKESKPHYLVGMSVPPVMTAQIATRIYDQWLSKFNPKPEPKG